MKLDRLPLAVCAECRAPIVWGQAADGTKVPLNPRRAATYRILAKQTSHVEIEKDAEPSYISHFLTCTKPERFSRSRSRRAGGDPAPDQPAS